MPDTYRWVGETPRTRNRTGERFEDGDEFNPTDHERRVFGDRLEAVDDSGDDDKPDGDREDGESTDTDENGDTGERTEL